MDYFIEKLNKNFEIANEHSGTISKTKYIASYIFNIASYDDDIEKDITNDLLQVVNAISYWKTFEYIKKCKDNHKNYIIMCNLLDKDNLIEWGTSIRGAWFQINEHKLFDNILVSAFRDDEANIL